MISVSIIIPNYNHEQYLKQRIDSVLNQSYQDFEVIILDDKSTDNSKIVIESYRSHAKISKIVYNEVNSGSTFKQWNKGINLAKGELIWLAESDDYASENFLEELVSMFEENQNLGIVYCNSNLVNEKNEILRLTHSWKNNLFVSNRWDSNYENIGVDEVNNYLIYQNIIDNASCALFKKSKIIEAGMADEKFKYVGDLYLYMKILMISDVAYLSKPLNYFREHSVNTTKKSRINGLRDYEDLLSYFKIIHNNKKISNYTKQKRWIQTVNDYKYFFLVNTKVNRNVLFLIKSNTTLIKANIRFSIKLLIKILITSLIKFVKSKFTVFNKIF